MKKFLLKVLFFFTCVVVMDFVLGCAFSWFRCHAKGGSTANCEYIANQSKDDVIILGSSRAAHHYIPQIIVDSLGISCYNCGEEGNGIILAYGRYKMLTERYMPKIILYEITPDYDYLAREDNAKFLGYLRQYYSKKCIRDLFDDFDDQWSNLKMCSKMYQNTQKLLPNIIDNIIYRDNRKGYAPLYGKIDVNKTKPAVDRPFEIDTLKLSYIEQLIKDAQKNEISLLFMISPRYNENEDLSKYEPVLLLCQKYNVPFLNFKNYKPIALNPEYFQDIGHMNSKGAEAYTNMLVREVLNNYLE